MPVDKKNQTVLSAVVSKDIGKEFKRLAKKHFRSVSAELAFLINQALESDKKAAPKDDANR